MITKSVPSRAHTRTFAIGVDYVARAERSRARYLPLGAASCEPPLRRAAQAAERLALGGARHDEGLVFAQPDDRPIPPRNFAEAFGYLVWRARVTRITLHDLRHAHASLLAKAGVSIAVVSQRLGHGTISITVSRYIAVYRDRDRQPPRPAIGWCIDDGGSQRELGPLDIC